MQVVVEQVGSVEVLSEIGVGPQGPAGDPANATLSLLAGENIGGHRVVRQFAGAAMYAHGAILADAEAVIGISLGAASLGVLLQVQRAGIITEPTWAWSAGPVFLTGAGLLTQIAPDTGVLLQVGMALSPTQLDVRISAPIELL
jgi:hypothetical protein